MISLAPRGDVSSSSSSMLTETSLATHRLVGLVQSTSPSVSCACHHVAQVESKRVGLAAVAAAASGTRRWVDQTPVHDLQG